MVSLKLATNSTRNTVVVAVDTVVNDIINMNEINLRGAAVHLDGCPILPDEFDCTLAELGIEDESEATLAVVVKADSAGCKKGNKGGKGK